MGTGRQRHRPLPVRPCIYKSKFSYPGYTIGYINNETIPNKDLKPTRTNSFEIGFETKFLNNRIGLDFTYYNQISKDQIMGIASSWTTGYPYRLIKPARYRTRVLKLLLTHARYRLATLHGT